jgi:hypothetical protein
MIIDSARNLSFYVGFRTELAIMRSEARYAHKNQRADMSAPLENRTPPEQPSHSKTCSTKIGDMPDTPVADAHRLLQASFDALRAAAESALATDDELLSVLTVAEGFARRN